MVKNSESDIAVVRNIISYIFYFKEEEALYEVFGNDNIAYRLYYDDSTNLLQIYKVDVFDDLWLEYETNLNKGRFENIFYVTDLIYKFSTLHYAEFNKKLKQLNGSDIKWPYCLFDTLNDEVIPYEEENHEVRYVDLSDVKLAMGSNNLS